MAPKGRINVVSPKIDLGLTIVFNKHFLRVSNGIDPLVINEFPLARYNSHKQPLGVMPEIN